MKSDGHKRRRRNVYWKVRTDALAEELVYVRRLKNGVSGLLDDLVIADAKRRGVKL